MSQPRRLVLVGHPVAHSLSPVFQQAALDAAGVPLVYETADVAPERFADAFRALGAEAAAGNITLPHKMAAVQACDVLTPLAQRVGAVNTFWTDAAGRMHGDNTDVGGFEAAAAALLGGLRPGLRVMLLGAGGAALAVRAAVAAWPGATLDVAARDRERAAGFVRDLGVRAQVIGMGDAALPRAVEAADLVVNATPLGLHSSDALPLDVGMLTGRQAVLDLTYRREGPTTWVAAAQARGIRADDGLRMLVEQGALAFERWFGQPAPRDVMWAAVGR